MGVFSLHTFPPCVVDYVLVDSQCVDAVLACTEEEKF